MVFVAVCWMFILLVLATLASNSAVAFRYLTCPIDRVHGLELWFESARRHRVEQMIAMIIQEVRAVDPEEPSKSTKSYGQTGNTIQSTAHSH